MNLQQAVKTFFEKYVTFSGRACRSEFWYVILAMFLAGIILGAIGAVIHTKALAYLFQLAILIPNLALVSRRLHDTDRSFWWALLGLIPIIGAIVLIVWYCTKGTAGDNRFGPDPLA